MGEADNSLTNSLAFPVIDPVKITSRNPHILEAKFVVFNLLNFADTIITDFGLRIGASEKNPLLTYLFDNVGMDVVWLFKIFFVLFITHRLMKKNKLASKTLSLMIGIYLIVLIMNIIAIQKYL